MRLTRYSIFSTGCALKVNARGIYNSGLVMIPPSPYMEWIIDLNLKEEDWRIVCEDSNIPTIRFFFRDPEIAMLFKLTFI
jgi:hypothetical protein